MPAPIAQTIPRAALVTGAARRIGRAVALDLAAAGFAVALHHHHSAAEADELAEDIRQQGGRAVALKADLAREGEVETLVPRAVAEIGPLGVLVNNASTFERDEALTATRASWDLHMEVNLRAPFVLSQAFARQLLNVGGGGQLPIAGDSRQAEGVVVNLLDQRVWNLTPHFTTYTLSKAGLWTLTQTLALALAPRVRVAAIGPGPALPSRRQTAEQFAAQVARTPLGKATSPEEIAAALRFILATPSFTGQMVALDGGQHLDWAPGGVVYDE